MGRGLCMRKNAKALDIIPDTDKVTNIFILYTAPERICLITKLQEPTFL